MSGRLLSEPWWSSPGWRGRRASAPAAVPSTSSPTAPCTSARGRRPPGRRAARGAAPAGLPRGARVGLALPPGEAYVVALHACLLAGALVVPVDLRLTAAERPPVAALLEGDGVGV